MFLVAVFFFSCIVASVFGGTLSDTDLSEWESFKATFGKSYDTAAEEEQRRGIYADNKRMIDAHNEDYESGKESYFLAVNHFADLHQDEIGFLRGFSRNDSESMEVDKHEGLDKSFMADLPTSIDWRHEGIVTDVKDQGQCGSCWAFSAVGSLEGQHARKQGKLVSLSEQNLVDCSDAYGNSGCNGGQMSAAFRYIKANGGIDTEASYPYVAKDGSCKYKRSESGANVNSFINIPRGSESRLTEALATVGPVSVAIDASGKKFHFYRGGVYYNPDCSNVSLDHGVVAVGYGRANDTHDYYIVKNSWGKHWGEGGYIKMARNRNNNCGIASDAVYPVV